MKLVQMPSVSNSKVYISLFGAYTHFSKDVIMHLTST